MKTIIKSDKRVVNGWSFYDWANSVYPLVITTAIFPIFYENSTDKNGLDTVIFFGREYVNTALYLYVVSVSFLLISVLSPILSGIADYSGNKKRFLQLFCYTGALGCMSLCFFNVDALELSMFSVLMASIGYWGSIVFYNAYLPEIAEPVDHDRISAKGYSLGYLGSSILLIICLGLIMNHQLFGFDTKDTATRFSFLLTGLWWVGWAQYTFRVLPNNIYNRKPSGNLITKGFNELKLVWNELRQTVVLKRYLIAFFIYSMGVQTVMLVAVLFAKKEIVDMQDSNLIVSVLLIQFIGIGGAYLFSFLSGRLGNLKALKIALIIWVGICVGTFLLVYNSLQFYVAAVCVGLVMGGIQSLSRSTYSKLLPETTIDHASYFSFYDVCEKIGIVIGTFSFAYIEDISGSMRNSILALIIFFVAGFYFLLKVPANKVVITPQTI